MPSFAQGAGSGAVLPTASGLAMTDYTFGDK